MRKLKVTEKRGIFKDSEVMAYILEPGDSISIEDSGITKDEFFAVLNKASQPIKKDKKSKSK